jgi:carbon storage regulator
VLVLTRRVGESIVIGNDVVVTVLEVRGEVVRVGIDAPREVAVHRQEVFDEVAAANRTAASPSDTDIAALTKDLPNNHAGGAPKGQAPRST